MACGIVHRWHACIRYLYRSMMQQIVYATIPWYTSSDEEPPLPRGWPTSMQPPQPPRAWREGRAVSSTTISSGGHLLTVHKNKGFGMVVPPGQAPRGRPGLPPWCHGTRAYDSATVRSLLPASTSLAPRLSRSPPLDQLPSRPYC